MKGSLVNRHGHYSIVLDDNDPVTGKRKQRWISAGDDYKEAQKQLTRTVNDYNNGNFVPPSKTTVKSYLESWLKDTALPNMTPRTFEGYEFMVNKHILPVVGLLPITGLKSANIQKLCAKHQELGHHRTAQYIFNTLHKSLNVAVKQGVILRNPCEGVISPKVPEHQMQTMSETDMHIFLEYARKSPYYVLFYTSLFTGMRRSELLALQWKSVDLELMQISVNRTIHIMRYGTYKGQIIFKQPKTPKSRRMIPLTPSNCVVLREHLEARKEFLKSVTKDSEKEKELDQEELVFCDPNGKPLHPDNISHYWSKLAKRTGLKGLRLHDARHTHASLLLKNGTHPKIVQERLGHASIETTLDTYSHVAPGLQKAAAVKFDEIVTGKLEVLAEKDHPLAKC